MPESQSQNPQPDRLDEEELFQTLRKATEDDLRGLAKLLAHTPDEHLFGQTEFTVRERVLRIGAKAFAATLAARQKGATKVPAGPVPTATARHGSSARARERS